MKTAQKNINNLINKNIFPLNISLLRQTGDITYLCQNIHFTYKILQYTCFNWTYYGCSWLNTIHSRARSVQTALSTFQYARYWLCTSIFDCFSQVVSPLYICATRSNDQSQTCSCFYQV